jgi:hypothetical protein
MSEPIGGHPDLGPEGEAVARARVEALFARFNSLTPDELGHIGLHRADPKHRAAQVEMVEDAARRSGRSVLLGEARSEARGIAIRRYSSGTLHPTWLALNWGLSQGTTEDRVAIIEALSDAVAVAVVEDLVGAEVTEDLSLDAEQVLGLAGGEANEGALAHAIEPPPPGMADTRARRTAVVVGAVVVGITVFSFATMLLSPIVGLAGGITCAGLVFTLGSRLPDDAAVTTADRQ